MSTDSKWDTITYAMSDIDVWLCDHPVIASVIITALLMIVCLSIAFVIEGCAYGNKKVSSEESGVSSLDWEPDTIQVEQSELGRGCRVVNIVFAMPSWKTGLTREEAFPNARFIRITYEPERNGWLVQQESEDRSKWSDVIFIPITGATAKDLRSCM